MKFFPTSTTSAIMVLLLCGVLAISAMVAEGEGIGDMAAYAPNEHIEVKLHDDDSKGFQGVHFPHDGKISINETKDGAPLKIKTPQQGDNGNGGDKDNTECCKQAGLSGDNCVQSFCNGTPPAAIKSLAAPQTLLNACNVVSNTIDVVMGILQCYDAQ